jgi:hypothetical protein
MRHARTFLDHLAPSKIDGGLNERESAHDTPPQRNELCSRLILHNRRPCSSQKHSNVSAIGRPTQSCMLGWYKERREVAHAPLRRAAETRCLRP